MIRTFASAARWFLAAVLMLLAIAGAMLPILPGFVFFGLAIAVMATESHLVRKWLRWLRRRFPRPLSRMKVPKGPTPAGERAAKKRETAADETFR